MQDSDSEPPYRGSESEEAVFDNFLSVNLIDQSQSQTIAKNQAYVEPDSEIENDGINFEELSIMTPDPDPARNLAASSTNPGGGPPPDPNGNQIGEGGNRPPRPSGTPSMSRSRTRSPSTGTKPTKKEDDNVDMRTLSQEKVRQLHARQALRQLRPNIQTQTWTPENSAILSNSVKLLLDATIDPSELRDLDADEEEPPRGRTGRPSGSGGGGGTKRPKSGSDSRSAKRQKVPHPSETPAGQVTIERLPPGSQARVPGQDDDLIKLNPQPIQTYHEPHALVDRDDEHFVRHFRKLFRRIETFFVDYFCIHDLDEGEFYQPWAADHAPEFLNYVLQVAEADPNGGGWDKILRDTNQRKWLLMGIMMSILENKVFNEDLWGATKEEKELMFSIEKALFTQEGFARTKLRSEAVRTIMGGQTLTTDFHFEVSKLTAQISLLFKPLVEYMYAIPPPEGSSIPKLWDQYQELHNIVSYAAYISLDMRLSPTIFYFTPLSPGEAFQTDDQHPLETQLFTASKKTVVNNYTAALKTWTEAKPALENRVQNFKNFPGTTGRKRGERAALDLEEHNKANPRHYGFAYRSLAKICAWPNIRRFKPGSIEQEQAGLPQEQRTGFRIYEVGKSAAVFYFGIEDRTERERQRVCLRGLVGEKQKRYGVKKERERSVVRAVGPYVAAFAAFAALPAWVFAERFKGSGEVLTEALTELMDGFRGGFVV